MEKVRTTKNRGGRPPLPLGEKRVPIHIKIDPRVLRKLRAAAKVAGIGYQTHINNLLANAVGGR